MKIKRHYWLGLLLITSLSLHDQLVSAQTWGSQQNLAGWWQDPATPGTGTHPTLNNNPFFNSALVTSMPTVMSGGSGASYSALASGGEGFTFHQLQPVDACTPAAAQANNEYFTSTASIRSDISSLRISNLVLSNFQGDGVTARNFQVSFAARDITTNGPLVFAIEGYSLVYSSAGGSNNVHNINSATAGWNFIPLIPGHTYEFRWYINKVPGADCSSGSAFKNMDNPSIDVQMVEPVSFSGTVFNDFDGAANGVSNQSAAQVSGLNAVLVDANGNVQSVVAVNASNGTYTFSGVNPTSSTSFRVMLTTTTPTVGQPAPSSASLPAGWLSTGEFNGTGTGSDGTANGISATFAPTGNLANINFGINRPPVAVNDAITGQPPGSAATIPNVLVNDTDPGGTTLSAGNASLLAPPWAVNPVTDGQGDVTSFSVAWQGTWTLNANGSVTFTPEPGFLGDPTPISYTVRDAAGAVSNPATLTVDFNAPVPVSGTVYNDNNGTAGGPNGTAFAGVTVTLYAANGTTVLATTTTNSSGNYSFPNQVPGNYVVGVAPPAGYQNVSSTDATPANGLTNVTVGSTAVSGVNFGLNQPPTATADNLASQVPGSPATVPNILVNDTDPNGGTLSPDNITLIAPAGATGITTDGQVDVTGFTVPGQGTWALNSSTGAVVFTPQAGFTADPTPINYTVADAAGLESSPAAITIDFNPPVPVNGTVYNDNNGSTGGPNGIALAGVAVTLYTANGTTVIATTTTDAGGNYSFANQVPGDYVVGVAPPAGYQNVSSTDATPANGLTNIAVGSTAVSGVNFGLNQPPVATADAVANQTVGSPATIVNILSNDADPNGGVLVADSISLVVPPGATGITTDAQGDITGFTVPGQGAWVLNTNGSVTFTPQSGFVNDPTPISYTVTDNASLNSNPATLTIDFNPPVPVSGTVYNDNNGSTGGPNGTALAGVTVTLYAANGTTVIATTTTDAGGNYSFANQVPGDYVVGVAPPAGYQNVSSTDATPANGLTNVTVGSTAVPGVNFGLNQPPVTTADVVANQVAGNPVTLPNILGNDTDPNGGVLAVDSISLVVPPGATGVTTDAQGDITGFTVPGQGAWVLNPNGSVTFTPQSGFGNDPTPVSYTVTDNAGLTSNPATLTIDYIPVPDLTPVITLPVNQVGVGETRNFVVRLNELRNVSTSSRIGINVAVPTGYTLSFDPTISTIDVLPANNFTISNTQWTALGGSTTSINLQSNTGFVISGNTNTILGFRLVRTTALSGSQGNITVSIFADPTRTYDFIPGNNFYSRIVTAN